MLRLALILEEEEEEGHKITHASDTREVIWLQQKQQQEQQQQSYNNGTNISTDLRTIVGRNITWNSVLLSPLVELNKNIFTTIGGRRTAMVFSWKLLTIVAAVLLLAPSQAWLFRHRIQHHNYDISRKSELTKLYNQPVRSVTHVERPLKGFPFMIGSLRHSGVVVNTADGRRFLIHKGKDYGVSSQTVVTDAKHMSPRWKTRESHPVSRSRVGDFVGVGGRSYHWLKDNCHSGRCRMMGLP
ncbi:hypothetical protein LSAT2_013889 [Lamellibrachia satsuma]|nr:hypothetical protein LSAT2_013889 [Lamellibrachia satsuma]